MENDYIIVLNKLLGNENFVKLSEELYLKVDKKYPRIDMKRATEIVEANMAVILIIGIEKKRGCIKEKIRERISWHNVCPKSLLIEKDIEKFIKIYEKYILIIKDNAIEPKSNIL